MALQVPTVGNDFRPLRKVCQNLLQQKVFQLAHRSGDVYSRLSSKSVDSCTRLAAMVLKGWTKLAECRNVLLVNLSPLRMGTTSCSRNCLSTLNGCSLLCETRPSHSRPCMLSDQRSLLPPRRLARLRSLLRLLRLRGRLWHRKTCPQGLLPR